MASNVEIEMFPTAYLELPLKKKGKEDDVKNRFQINLSLNEIFLGKKFDRLELNITVGIDDPRLRAIDIYTQYAGVRSILIKHFPSFWPNGIIHKSLFPNWSDEKDRIIKAGKRVKTEFEESCEYNGATGLRAHSHQFEINGSVSERIVYDTSLIRTIQGQISETKAELNNTQDSSKRKKLQEQLAIYESFLASAQRGTKVIVTNANLELGMLRGNEPGSNSSGNNEETETSRILVKLSERREIVPGSEGEQVAIKGRNPLHETHWILKDFHPIPFSVYMIDYYYIDNAGKFRKESIVGKLWNPDHMKAGKIVSVTNHGSESGYAPFSYTVKVIDGGNNGGWTFHFETVKKCWFKFNVGDWVVIAKIGSLSSGILDDGDSKDLGWSILPTSKLYYTNAVDFLREQLENS